MIDIYKTIKDKSEGTYTELRSKFLAFAHPISTVEEAMALVEQYQKKYYDARHVCWAYMIGADRETFRSNDNGEPSGTAGKPILGQINSNELTDIIILVVRYFGGVKLGTSGLIVAYRTAAAEAIAAATIEERQVEATYDFSFEYPLMTAVMKVVRDMNARILEQSYDMDCRMSVSIRKGLLDELKTRIQKAISPF
ncbi:MAG: YigZ family protein [Bacteroidaceae bacterium]|nr:YigZ family protein [Bacteroidaceae bacterium]MBO7167773.1 YigZ family protein [Bacteroidaceae bacterium]